MHSSWWKWWVWHKWAGLHAHGDNGNDGARESGCCPHSARPIAPIRSWWGVAQVGQVSTPTANVLQGLQKTVEANRVDDVVMLLFEEMQTAKNNGHTMPLSVVFVERKVSLPQQRPLLFELPWVGDSRSRIACWMCAGQGSNERWLSA